MAPEMEQVGFTVRVGYRHSITKTVSGLILFAFQPEDIRAAWLAMVEDKPSPGEVKKFVAAADLARQNGYARAPSTVVNGITDISAPIKRGERAIAALTVPYIKTTSGASALELRECARPPSGRVSPRLASIVKIGYQ
jgi:DNA-binding IclR family transcriptional regulator